MFGYHRNKREKKRLKKEKRAFEEEKNRFNAQKPELERQNDVEMKNQINTQAQEAKTNRQEARKEGRAYAEDVLSRDIQGLTPAQRQAIQYEASQRINRDTQQAERKLLGEQGRRGIGGKSGVAFAQQQELARAGQEAQGQATRDTEKLNADLAMKKLAAMFNIEQGEAAQSQLDRQMAIDELELSNEKKRQRAIEDQMNRLFSRL
jgi:hypothetical protein